ncbi:Six-hairpin glycosidase-like protein [Lactifluus subvellereus]|nr:Six-hairpin glycosidase-like protein [Lactifluus subvellereus]
MHPPLFLLAFAASIAVAANQFSRIKHTNNTRAVRDYLDRLVPVSKSALVHELMGPTFGFDPGVIIPIIPDPKYPEFTVYWLRDGCRVYHTWLNELTMPLPHDDIKLLRTLVDDSVHALVRTQHVVSLSGNVFTGGLEEPVFDIHLGTITNPAYRPGSPAADGPPFRAIVLVMYAEWLIEPEQNNGTWVADVLWPAINLDLQWISLHWNQSSWDLWWPPVWGGSYWTASLQYRALRAGARLSQSIGRGDNSLELESHASMILDYLQTFWNEEEGYMSETTVTDVKIGGRSGKGTAPLTVSVLNFDPSLGCDAATFQPCSDRALSSLEVVGNSFKGIFPISNSLPPDQPNALLGWYLEEELLGGHAQYFATLHAAEQIFDALITWDLIGELQVTDVSLKFFRQFDQNIGIGTYPKGSEVYESLTDDVTSWAERTLLLLADHTPDDYVLTQAIDRATGEPVGPRGTLHCLVSALSVYDAYNGFIPPSWAHGGRFFEEPWNYNMTDNHDNLQVGSGFERLAPSGVKVRF